MARYAITDIHGCSRSFSALLQQLKLEKSDTLYLLGDYIDRGPDSRGVVETILGMRQLGYTLHCLTGNHEQLLIQATHDESTHDHWLFRNGGIATLVSYADQHGELDLPDEHLLFFDELEMMIELEDYVMVHAGINFTVDDPAADQYAMLWRRGWYGEIDHQWLDGRIILHGHTPTQRPLIEYRVAEELPFLPAIDLDAGCVARERFGWLCAFDLDSRQLYWQACIDPPFHPTQKS